MVENTLENKSENKKGPTLPRTLLMIVGGIFVALVFSVYWRINHIQDFLGNGSANIPNIKPIEGGMSGLEDIMNQAQGQTDSSADPYRIYTTPDGYLSIKYPSSFTDGRNIMEGLAGKDLGSTNYLLYAYRIDRSSSEAQLITLIAARYDATSTEDVIAQIKKSLDQQHCQSDIKESETIISNASYRLFDSTYKCSGQGEASLWQARTAVVKKNDAEFYAVTGTAANKNWESAKLDINSIFESISVSQPVPAAAPEEPSGVNENNNSQNNETAN